MRLEAGNDNIGNSGVVCKNDKDEIDDFGQTESLHDTK